MNRPRLQRSLEGAGQRGGVAARGRGEREAPPFHCRRRGQVQAHVSSRPTGSRARARRRTAGLGRGRRRQRGEGGGGSAWEQATCVWRGALQLVAGGAGGRATAFPCRRRLLTGKRSGRERLGPGPFP